MRKGFIIIAIIFILAAILFVENKIDAASCGGWFQPSCDNASGQQRQEQENITQTINRLENNTSIPRLEQSLERINIKRRLELFSDETKISYIYLVSYGKVMAFYTLKGKITSGGKRLTSQERLVSGEGNSGYIDFVMESPELDGTYGKSGDYIFFWTTDGIYVQWNGEYMLADQPLKLTQPPELIREIK